MSVPATQEETPKECKSCKWYSLVLIEPRANMVFCYEFCKRYPPHPIHGHARTTESNTCGEWKETLPQIDIDIPMPAVKEAE